MTPSDVEGPRRLLVASDDSRFRRVICFLLARRGFSVEEVMSSCCLVTLGTGQPIDAVVLDGGCSLAKAAETVALIGESYPDVGVIIVTGGEDLAESGPDATLILPKWGSFRRLVRAIEWWRPPARRTQLRSNSGHHRLLSSVLRAGGRSGVGSG